MDRSLKIIALIFNSGSHVPRGNPYFSTLCVGMDSIEHCDQSVPTRSVGTRATAPGKQPRSGARQGVVTVLLLVSLVLLLGFGALALNLAWLTSHQVQLRQACESSALAGAAQLLDPAPGAASSVPDPAAAARVPWRRPKQGHFLRRTPRPSCKRPATIQTWSSAGAKIRRRLTARLCRGTAPGRSIRFASAACGEKATAKPWLCGSATFLASLAPSRPPRHRHDGPADLRFSAGEVRQRADGSVVGARSPRGPRGPRERRPELRTSIPLPRARGPSARAQTAWPRSRCTSPWPDGSSPADPPSANWLPWPGGTSTSNGLRAR